MLSGMVYPRQGRSPFILIRRPTQIFGSPQFKLSNWNYLFRF